MMDIHTPDSFLVGISRPCLDAYVVHFLRSLEMLTAQIFSWNVLTPKMSLGCMCINVFPNVIEKRGRRRGIEDFCNNLRMKNCSQLNEFSPVYFILSQFVNVANFRLTVGDCVLEISFCLKFCTLTEKPVNSILLQVWSLRKENPWSFNLSYGNCSPALF